MLYRYRRKVQHHMTEERVNAVVYYIPETVLQYRFVSYCQQGQSRPVERGWKSADGRPQLCFIKSDILQLNGAYP